ncbi:antizyme inhibitor 2-like [Thomomys bottae]
MPELSLAEASTSACRAGFPDGDLEKTLKPPRSPWPLEAITLQSGESAQQVVLRKIQELSGTDNRDPFMVAHLDMLVSRHETFCRALPQVRPFYAVKCNSSPWVLRVLASLGLGFDCASQWELEQVLGLGVAPSRIIFANPYKAISHIRYAALHGVQLLTFDSEEELTKVVQHHPGARLLLRIQTEHSRSTFPLRGKFGASLEECRRLLTSATGLGLAVVGATFHVGSDCYTPQSYTQAIADCRLVFEMGREAGHHMDLLDLGGGFPGAEGSQAKFEEMAKVINAALAQTFPEESGVRVMAEPGRFYAESMCTTAVNIIAKKVVRMPGGLRKLMYYLNDGHYGTFRLCLREAAPKTPIVAKEFLSEPPLFSCTLFGPTCDAFDRLFTEEVQLPELDVGDWLVFPSTGAYSSSMSSTFNGFPPAAVCYAMSPQLRNLLETMP